MTAIIIIAAIALLIFFLLASFVTADLEYDEVFKFKVKYLCFTLAKNPLSPKEKKKKERKAEKKKRKEEKKELKEKAKRDKLLAKKRKARNKTAAAAKNTETAKKNTDTEDSAKTSPQPDTNTKKAKTGDKDKSEKEKENKDEKRKITPELIFRIFGKAKPHVKRIFKKIRISGVYINATIGGEDAAKAAISYGVHCAAIDGLIAFLDNTVSFKAEKIEIRADFDLEKSVYYCKARVKLRLSTLLHSGIWGALAVIGELKEVSDITEKDENKKSPQKAA